MGSQEEGNALDSGQRRTSVPRILLPPPHKNFASCEMNHDCFAFLRKYTLSLGVCSILPTDKTHSGVLNQQLGTSCFGEGGGRGVRTRQIQPNRGQNVILEIKRERERATERALHVPPSGSATRSLHKSSLFIICHSPGFAEGIASHILLLPFIFMTGEQGTLI